MTIEARYNLQRGKAQNNRFPATNYTSDGSLIDQYTLAKVQMRNSAGDRIILDPSAFDALVDQAAKDIEKKVYDLLKIDGFT